MKQNRPKVVSHNQEMAIFGEEIVKSFMINKGLTLKGQRIRRFGYEIDLLFLCSTGKTYHIVEVKTLTVSDLGVIHETVDRVRASFFRKRRMIERFQEDFLVNHETFSTKIRLFYVFLSRKSVQAEKGGEYRIVEIVF